MKIIECHVDNFGKLSDIRFLFNDGLNVICQDNGFGKSTLAAFIRIMFFGFYNDTKRNDIDNERLRYAPWNGGIYGGSITFLVNDRIYKVIRRFGAKDRKEDEFSIFDANTLKETDDYSDNLGEEIFSIDAESFIRTIFIPQQNCETNATSNISAKLGNLATVSDDISNFDESYNKLTKKINALSPDKKTGEIFKVKQQLLSCEEEIRRGARIYDDIYQTETLIESKRVILQNLKVEQQGIINRIQKENDSSRVDLIGRYGYICQHYNEAYRRYKTELDFFGGELIEPKFVKRAERIVEENNNDKADRKYVNLFPIIAILMVVLGFIAFSSNKALFVAIILMGLILFVIGLLRKSKINQQNTAREANREVNIRNLEEFFGQFDLGLADSYDEKLRIVKEHYNRCIECEKEYNLSLQSKEEFEQQNNLTDNSGRTDKKNLSDAVNELNKSLEGITAKIDEANYELNRLKGDLSELNIEVTYYEKKLAAQEDLKCRLDKLTYSYNIYKNTRDYLCKARENYFVGFRKPVKAAFDKYYNMLSNGDASLYALDADMEIRLIDGSSTKSIKKLSEGYKDLVGICMRMAFSEVMFKGENPFFIFDDSFVNLDDRKTENAMEFLKKVAQHNQIIYFTCHKNIMVNCDSEK